MVQTTLRIPEKLYEQIKEQAKQRGMTVNGFIIAILCEKKVLQVQRGVREMEKVDELIESLAEHIIDKILSGKEFNQEISEKTKALAELISARASML